MKIPHRYFILLIMSLFLVIPQVHAEKIDFIDKEYNFKTIKAVYICNINLDLLNSPDAHCVVKGSDLVEKVLQQDYWDNAKKFAVYDAYNHEQTLRKLSLLTGKNIDQMIAEDKSTGEQFFNENIHLLADAYVRSTLLAYYDDYYIIPAHTEWRSVTEYDDYYDKDGHKHTRSRTIQVPEFVPAESVRTANVRIRFSLIDSKTGKEIFSREEARCNTYTTDCQECYRQTVRSFFRDLKGKIKK